MTSTEEDPRRKRQTIYHVIVLVALAIAAGRIAVVESQEGDTAFLSANDRSRWCTVASLVEHGSYAIDKQIAITDAKHRHRHPWQTIDKVRHLGRDGKQHYYSSKPPLFPTLVAGVYKVVNLISGMTLTEQPIYVARIVLALVNLPLLALFFYATIGCIDLVGRSPWGRILAATSTCFATMLLPFAVSLNNHLPAASATAATMWIYMCVAKKREEASCRESFRVSVWFSLASGGCAALAAANELPALSMMVFWFILFAVLDRSSVVPFVFGAAVVACGFFGTNWIAHQSLRPAYAHRGNGSLIADLQLSSQTPDAQLAGAVKNVLSVQSLLHPDSELRMVESELRMVDSDEPERWIVEVGQQRFALLRGEDRWQLTHWDDWYEYPGTYWKEGRRRGVDRGEPSRSVYLLQMTIGHHGLFSLTPIWLLVPLGLVSGLRSGTDPFRKLALAVLVASMVCLLFYVGRPLVDRNYGGVTVCFRWMLWFAPLWLLVIAPVLDAWAEHKTRRIAVFVMLALSVFSVSASLATPWQSPWLYRFWQFLGWIAA